MIEKEDTQLLSRGELLKRYHNKHLNTLVAHSINLNLFANLDENEIVANVPVEVPGQEQPTMRQIKVKDHRKMTIQQYNHTYALLKSIEGELEKEGIEVPENVKAPGLAADLDDAKSEEGDNEKTPA